jgi:anti-sigma factor RsiW
MAFGNLRQRLDHRWSRRHLSEFIDGELSARDRRRLEAHASVCPECGRMRRTLAVLVHELRRLAARRSNGSVAPAVVERIRREDERRRAFARRPN